MCKFRNRILQVLVVCFLISIGGVQAQAPNNYVITLWSFDETMRYREDRPIAPDYNLQTEPSEMLMLGGDIERDGTAGETYVDTCGTNYNSTHALRWDDVRGDDDDIDEDDAQLQVTVSTTDWEDIAFRFHYLSEHVETFDLSYHLGDGNWKLLADNVVIDAFDSWNSIEVGLQDVEDIENRQQVVFLVHDLTREFGRRKFFMDNIAVMGKRISSRYTCPPVIEPVNPVEDMTVTLGGDIPVFTGDNGLQFKVTDGENSFDELMVLAVTTNPNVINQLGLTVLDPAEGLFQLDIGSPHGIAGHSDVIIRVIDRSGAVGEYRINYDVIDPSSG